MTVQSMTCHPERASSTILEIERSVMPGQCSTVMGTSRTTPTKLAIAPIFGSPKAFTSAERSKSSRCTEIFTSSSGDRRKERDFIGRPDGRGRLDHVLVHRGRHAPRFSERLG